MNLSSIAHAGKITIAAFDHRASLAEKLGWDLAKAEDVKKFTQLKQIFMTTFSPICSAVLTDPIYGQESVDFKDPRAGLLMSLEESGYEGGYEAVPPLVADWGIDGVKSYHAAAKLLLYFLPAEKLAAAKVNLVASLFEESRRKEVIFLLEPVIYRHENYAADLPEIVRLFTDKCDALKLEYPGLKAKSEAEELALCQQVTELATVPWVLLSRGMEYDKFKKSLKIALEGGAVGFAVGRAVWQEIYDLNGVFGKHWHSTNARASSHGR